MYTYGTLGIDTQNIEKELTDAGYKLEKIYKLRWFKTDCPPDKILQVLNNYGNGKIGHAKESEIKGFKEIREKIWEQTSTLLYIESES